MWPMGLIRRKPRQSGYTARRRDRKLVTMTYGKTWQGGFSLDPGLIHANHGSYGAVPRVIADAQRQIRAQLDANPTGFLRDIQPGLVRAAAARVAGFLGGSASDWVFVDNATAGVSAVLASTRLDPGDEVLITDQTYGAVRKAVAQLCRRTGARIVEVRIALPVAAPADVLAAVTWAATDRTRLVVLDHVSSPCGLVLPIAALCQQFRQRGIPVLVDGAHGPANVAVDVEAIGADFYTGNAHKWLCAPPGAGMLWCRPEHQPDLHPLVISHGFEDGYTSGFDWPGTRDPSAWLSVPAAIDFHQDNGGPALRERNRKTALQAGHQLAADFGTVLAAPADMQSSMVTIQIWPDRELNQPDCAQLQRRVQLEQNAVVATTAAGGATWLRLSAAIYSEADELVEAGRRVWACLQGGAS